MKHVVITIGREYGSGGRLVAKMLSEKLGIPFYDKEIIQGVAEKTGFSESFIRDSEKQPTGSFLFDLYASIQTPSLSDQVFIAQAKTIREVAAKESCVIVGRCADYILQERPECLRVFVYAPVEERVWRARGEYGITEANIEAFIARQDKARAAYYNYFATGRWGERQAYDLCVNSAIGLEQAVDIIAQAAMGKGQSN